MAAACTLDLACKFCIHVFKYLTLVKLYFHDLYRRYDNNKQGEETGGREREKEKRKERDKDAIINNEITISYLSAAVDTV